MKKQISATDLAFVTNHIQSTAILWILVQKGIITREEFVSAHTAIKERESTAATLTKVLDCDFEVMKTILANMQAPLLTDRQKEAN